MPGAGPNRRGHNEFESAITTETVGSLTERWAVQAGGNLLGDPVWSAGGIHHAFRTASGQVALQTLRPSTGEEVWSVAQLDQFHEASDPVVIGDEVYVGTGTTSFGGRWSIAGFDTATGEPGAVVDDAGLINTARQRTFGYTWKGGVPNVGCATAIGVTELDDPSESWRTQVQFSQSSCPDEPGPPTIGADRVYHAGVGRNSTEPGTGTTGNGMRSYSITPPPECGSGVNPDRCPAWATPLPGTSASPPVIGAGGATIYTATDTGTLYAVDATDGTILWSAPLGTRAGTPALADGSLFVPTDTGLHVLDADGCGADECAPIWTAGTVAHSGQPAVAGGVVFAKGAGGLHAYAAGRCGAATCPSIWSTSPGSGITTGPVVTGGQLYVGTADGRLIAYGPAS
jgi:outer membrane protein assembly factor BamB